MENNWKEEFRDNYGGAIANQVEKFIETEVIEKLLADMPDYDENIREHKQQLRTKWLGGKE